MLVLGVCALCSHPPRISALIGGPNSKPIYILLLRSSHTPSTTTTIVCLRSFRPIYIVGPGFQKVKGGKLSSSLRSADDAGTQGGAAGAKRVRALARSSGTRSFAEAAVISWWASSGRRIPDA